MPINNMLNTGTSFPSVDGSNGQALVTDGAGTISWQTVGGISYPGIYVSQILGNDLNPGTFEQPVATINQGISLCPVFTGTWTTVFIMDSETYDEEVSINKQGVNISGPFASVDCTTGDALTMTDNFTSLVEFYTLTSIGNAIKTTMNGNLVVNVGQYVVGNILNDNNGAITVNAAFSSGAFINGVQGSISGKIDQLYFGTSFTPAGGLINIFNNFQFLTGNTSWANNFDERFLSCPIVNPTPNANAFYPDVTVSFSDLSGGSFKIIQNVTDSSQRFKVRGIMTTIGTNFAGGDRDITISDDSTNTYTVIPAASLAALVNSTWGDVGLPFSVSLPLNTPSDAGTWIGAYYSGGTTDYTSGSFSIILELERIV